jgi:D-alanine-D-alanine ligase
MKIAILFDEISPWDVLADRDVLQQVKIVTDSLSRLGHEWSLVPCTLDLMAFKDDVIDWKPDICFNVLDTLDSKDSLCHLPIEVLDANGIKHTGPNGLAIAMATRKLQMKDILNRHNIPTPKYLTKNTLVNGRVEFGKWIIKSSEADGSNGMSDTSVVDGDVKSIITHLQSSCGVFAEQYIDGREFTVPFLCGKTLPVVEVTYNDYPEGKPKILAQAAKWQPESFESKHTGIQFPIGHGSRLIWEIRDITGRCIDLFNLRGWGRIDFRVCENPNEPLEGQIPYVIDINSNCFLAPDAWWAQSLDRENIEFDSAIQSIIDEAI